MSKLLTVDELLAPSRAFAPKFIDIEKKDDKGSFILDEAGNPVYEGRVKVAPLNAEALAKITSGAMKGDGTMDTFMFQLLALVHGVVEPKFSVSHIPQIKTSMSPWKINKIASEILAISEVVGFEESKKNLKETRPAETSSLSAAT